MVGFCLCVGTAQAQSFRPQFYPVPGLTLAEMKVQWLWSVLPNVIKACRVQPSCQMSEVEKKSLDGMIANLKNYSVGTLQFESEKANPGRFTSDQNEAHRVAVTGLTPDSKIILNSDRIGDMELRDLLAILGHETVHHTGVLDDAQRLPDSIGSKLGHYFELNSVSANLEEYGHPEIQAVYFGVGVPETIDYFKTFPEPTVQLDARVLLMDKAGAFDLSAFDPSHGSNCYTMTGAAYVNQQVSDPLIRVSRWFPGDKYVSLDFVVYTRNVCLIIAHVPNADLQGVPMIGQMSLQFELAQPSVTQWSDSVLSLRTDFLRAISRPRVPEEETDAMAMVRVEKVLSAPTTVNAGSTWKAEVLLRYLGSESVSGCEADVRGATWHSLDLLGLSPPLTLDHCSVQVHPDGLYQVSLEKNYPADSYPGIYSTEIIGLVIPASKGGFAVAKMPVPLSVSLTNAKPPPPLKIASHSFSGGKTLQAGQDYTFEVRLENAHDVYDGLMSGEFMLFDGNSANVMGNMAAEQGMFVGQPAYRQDGSVLVITYKINVPTEMYGTHVREFRLYTLQFTTSNFGEAYLDLRGSPEVYTILN